MEKMKRLGIFVFFILVLFAPALSHAATPAQTPSNPAAKAVVKDFYTQLVDTMKQGNKLGFAGRYKKLAPAIRSAFNLPLMARYAVGPVWNEASPAEQQQLVSAFSDFSVATYASRFTSYDGERFDITGQKPSPGGVIVETKLTPKEGDAVTLDYLMKADDAGNWRIVDVFLAGAISELATRRAEFSSIVRRDGFPALVNSLSEKSKQMGPS
jgi:phospholipid transport system substrate-binding protein